MNEFENEVWKPIPTWLGYEVSNIGRVRSLERSVKTKKGGLFKVSGRILLPNRHTFGYPQVKLCADGRIHKSQFIHRLVATVFIPNPDNKETVNHIDGVKSNNHVTNLEWATMSENALHKFHVLNHKANKPMLGLKGRLSPHRKRITVESKDGTVEAFECASDLSVKLNISKNYCSMLANGKGREPFFERTGFRISYTPTV